MMTPHWRLRFLKIAEEVSGWSKDPSTKVGAVVVSQDRKKIAVGYNGPARSLNDKKWLDGDRGKRLSVTLHAELNALLSAPFDPSGCWLFVYGAFPCTQCASVIVQREIVSVVCYKEQMLERWSPKLSMEILNEGGVNVVIHSLKKSK